MSNKNSRRTKPFELAAMTVGFLAIIAAAYLIFAAKFDGHRMTNLLISGGFLVYIAYSFMQSTNLRRDLAETEEILEKEQKAHKNTTTKLANTRNEVLSLKDQVTLLDGNLKDAEAALKACKEEAAKNAE